MYNRTDDDAVGRNPESKDHRKLTRDGMAKPVSRDQILRREQGEGNGDREKNSFSVQLTTSRIGSLTQSIHPLLAIVYGMTIKYYSSTVVRTL